MFRMGPLPIQSAEASAADTANPRHHPNWQEVRDTYLADPDVQQAYQDLAPRFAVVQQLITLREQHG